MSTKIDAFKIKIAEYFFSIGVLIKKLETFVSFFFSVWLTSKYTIIFGRQPDILGNNYEYFHEVMNIFSLLIDFKKIKSFYINVCATNFFFLLLQQKEDFKLCL